MGGHSAFVRAKLGVRPLPREVLPAMVARLADIHPDIDGPALDHLKFVSPPNAAALVPVVSLLSEALRVAFGAMGFIAWPPILPVDSLPAKLTIHFVGSPLGSLFPNGWPDLKLLLWGQLVVSPLELALDGLPTFGRP